MDSKYYDATIICKDGSAKKYHTIDKFKLTTFELWAASKFPDVCHINYYSKSGKFIVQHKISV